MGNVWDPEVTVSPILAVKLIENQFPMLAPVNLSELGKGFDNTVYTVNEHYVFRFPRRSIAAPLLLTENAILPALAKTLPIAIPVPCFFGSPVRGHYPWNFTGFRLVHGLPPGKLSTADRMKSAPLLARFLRVLHAFPLEKARELHVPNDELGRLNLTIRKPRLLSSLQKIKNLALYPQVDKLLSFIDQPRSIAIPKKEVLVHGDLHLRNMTVNADQVVNGIIDWGDVHIGHPAIDLSIAYSFLPPEGRTLFFKEYGGVDSPTKEMARFKAIFTASVLLLYSYDLQDEELKKAAVQSLDLLCL